MRKSKLSILLCALLVIGFTACEEDTENQANNGVDDATVEVDASAEEMYDDVDAISAEGMVYATAQGGRFLTDDASSVTKCATLTLDKENKTVTVDFGEGCDGPYGRERKGKIIITYTDRRFVSGSTITTTFEEFFVDGNKIEGTRTVKNITEDGGAPTFAVTLVGGKITFEDGTFSTREASHTRVWVRAQHPSEDEYRLTGNASGINRLGKEYTATIENALVFKRACWADRIFIPVRGTKVITRGTQEATIDYGDGNCDKDITITRNGEESVVELKRRN